ncbi:hypothetical protein EJ08DRAFT_674409 [Tothia fuscella]|uniref:SWIRM domain-containing protein n=1 Tax=Tothia fuscella TaxID=1048955 RepID=A0A9P4P3C2_9PEZI|nr:hypothetical protein EJ08DRAFT_674409 [Tothia fuscella]
MFGLPTGQVNGIDNSSILYTATDDLLSTALLTPDPDPKFDLSGTKSDDAPFGDFSSLGIFEQYHESVPSSIHFGDGIDFSEHGGSHGSTKDDLTGATSALVGIHASANGVEQSPVHHYNIITPSDFHQNGMTRKMFGRRSNGSKSLAPTPQHRSTALTPPDQDIQYDHIKVKTSPRNSPKQKDNGLVGRNSTDTSPRKASGISSEFRAKSSIPAEMSWFEFARQGILAAYSSRLNPYALHPAEYRLLRGHITRPQVTIYLNIRNAILRMWHRSPLVGVTRQEAAGCVRESRYFALSQVAYDWLLRNGYINFGCVELSHTARSIPRAKAKGGRRRTIVIIGAGMSGLGCARQLEGLTAQLGEHFSDKGEKAPKIIVLEGRNRVGGRVYSHPLKKQIGSLPDGLRNTAEMGAQIITGFEHGNPLNTIIRGQLALRYYALKDTTVVYDFDGQPVDQHKDTMIEKLWNDVLERAAEFRNKLPTVRTVEGDKFLIQRGEDPKEVNGENAELISSLEDAGVDITITDGNPISTNSNAPEHSSIGVDKVGGRQYQLAGSASKSTAAEAARSLGWQLQPDVSMARTLNLVPVTQASKYPNLGEVMDEGIKQYQEMLGLTAGDLRLLNWHHANLEYANAANVNQLSLGGWDQDTGNEFEGEHTEVIGGYTQVPRGLWQFPEPLDIRFNHPVRSIKYDAYGHSPTVIECTNGEKIEADQVVLTASLGVLKSESITFSPPLPDWKTSCIERMGFGLLNKVVLVYEKPFWEENRDIFGLLNKPEHDGLDQKAYASRRGRFYLFWNRIKTSGRPMLVALMAGTAAYSVEEEEDESLVKEVTERLAKVFAPTNIPKPSETIVTRWKRDPFARGSYSYVGPQTLVGDYDVMARPVGSIHFSGEATCGTHPATVHGAYLSGLRAASDVIESLLGPIEVPSPLVSRRSKADNPPSQHSIPSAPTIAVMPTFPATKRKRGYVDVWEPILPPPDPNASVNTQAEVEAYEARIIGAILVELGDRPIKPEKSGVNPYLLYQKDEWYNVKARCDAEEVTKANNATAKATRDQIRIVLGAQWRALPEGEKKPYIEKSQAARQSGSDAMAEYNEAVKVWDQEASRIRREFLITDPPAHNVKEKLEGRTAIELGGGRKGRKMNGYGEDSD